MFTQGLLPFTKWITGPVNQVLQPVTCPHMAASCTTSTSTCIAEFQGLVDVVRLLPVTGLPVSSRFPYSTRSLLQFLIAAGVSDRDERQPVQNRGGGHDLDHLIWFMLIQLLHPALTSFLPPRGGIPVDHNSWSQETSLYIMYSLPFCLPFWCARYVHKVYTGHVHLPGA